MPSKKKSAPAKKPAVKTQAGKTVSKKSPPAKPAAVPVKKEKNDPSTKATASREALRARLLGAKKKPAKPIAFSLDEVRAIAKTVTAKDAKANAAKAAAKPALAKKADLHAKPVRTAPNHVKPASLADILGFNPRKAKSAEAAEENDVPEKFKRFYKLLIDLRKHLTAGIELHSELFFDGENQIQMLQSDCGHLLGVKGTMGVPKLHKEPGEWNAWEVTCIGPKASLKVNGTLAWDVDTFKAKTGTIGIEAEGHAIDFRNLRIKVIAK